MGKFEENYNFNVREKRINIIYKAMYIIATFTGIIFLKMDQTIKDGITNNFLLEICILAFFLPLLFCMLFYIFKETSHIKPYIDGITEQQLIDIESSYQNIYKCVCLSGGVSVISFTISLIILEFSSFNKTILTYIEVISFILCTVLPIIKNKKINQLNLLIAPIAIISIFLLVALNNQIH